MRAIRQHLVLSSQERLERGQHGWNTAKGRGREQEVWLEVRLGQGTEETVGKTWRQWNSLERECRTGLVPLGASMLDGPWEVDGEQRGGGRGTGGWSTHWSWEDAGSRQPL